MLTKNDLQEVKSVVKEGIETAVVQISSAVIKALENTATKDDLKNIATKDDLDGVESRLDGVEKDLKIVKRGVEILQHITPNQIEFADHEKRISHLEKVTFPS